MWSSFESSQVQIRHGQLAGGGRVDNWGPEKVRKDSNTGWWTLEGGGMMLAEDSRTLRLCWAPTEGRCRWKGAKVTLDDLFQPGGRTDPGAGGRVDEARQGKGLCLHDREAGKAGGACKVEATLSILTLFLCICRVGAARTCHHLLKAGLRWSGKPNGHSLMIRYVCQCHNKIQGVRPLLHWPRWPWGGCSSCTGE